MLPGTVPGVPVYSVMEMNLQLEDEEKSSIEVFSSKKKPLRNVLKSVLVYQCERCNKVYEKKTNLLRHVNTAHSESFDCPQCGKNFASPSNLLRHLREQHPEATTYSCADCGESFATKAEFQSHKKIHRRRAAIFCGQCNETFLYKKDLKTHIKEAHKEIPRITDEQPIIIPDYILTEDGKTTQIFRCNLCSRAFNLKTDLLRHFLIHSGEKPFGCDMCESRFNRKSNLLRHRRSMHNVIDETEAYRYRKQDLRQRRNQNREIWEIESEALAEEERIIREQEIIDKQRRVEARLQELMQEKQFSEDDDGLVIADDDDQNYSDVSAVLVESGEVPKSGMELALLKPDEKLTVRILTYDS